MFLVLLDKLPSQHPPAISKINIVDKRGQCLAYNCADSLNTILIIIRKICKNLFFKFISGIIGRASLSTSSCDIQNQHCRQKRQNTLSSESGQLHDRIVLETAPVALFPHQHATGMSM